MADSILFKGGKIQFESSKIIFVPNGGDPDNCACCGGCAYNNSCSNCAANKTPDTMRVTISGISACSTCFNQSGTSSYYQLALSGINGSHDLAHQSGCVWSKSIAAGSAPFTESSFGSSSDCSGTPTDTDIGVRIDLTRTASGWSFLVTDENDTWVFFYDEQVEAGSDCDDTPTFTNDQDGATYACGDMPPSGSGGSWVGGTGGTASAVCV